jgi:hypothetical protein
MLKLRRQKRKRNKEEDMVMLETNISRQERKQRREKKIEEYYDFLLFEFESIAKKYPDLKTNDVLKKMDMTLANTLKLKGLGEKIFILPAVDRFVKIITQSQLRSTLSDICERVHASCDDECPVYETNNHSIPWDENQDNCICFRNGGKMLVFIEEKQYGK